LCFSVFVDLLLGFSAYSNTKALFTVTPKNTKKDVLTCLNGIRFISMTWVIVGHAYSDVVGIVYPSSNLISFAPKVNIEFPFYCHTYMKERCYENQSNHDLLNCHFTKNLFHRISVFTKFLVCWISFFTEFMIRWTIIANLTWPNQPIKNLANQKFNESLNSTTQKFDEFDNSTNHDSMNFHCTKRAYNAKSNFYL